MNAICRKLQNDAAECGVQVLLGNEAAQRHVRSCLDCAALVDALSEVEREMHGLGDLDAPDDLVDRLLARPELQASTPSRSWISPGRMAWGSAIAAMLLVAVFVGNRSLLEHTIAEQAPKVVTLYHERLSDRVNELLAQGRVKIDEETLAREVAIFADRCDIAEEISRLRGHVEQFRAAGTKAVAVQADVSDAQQAERMVGQARDALGGTIDILVNNAGTQYKLSTVEDMPLDLWNKVLALNLTSAMVCARSGNEISRTVNPSKIKTDRFFVSM